MSAAAACGKVILAGEHAAVYGYRAVAVGLDRGARARMQRTFGPRSVLAIRGQSSRVREIHEGDDDDLARAFGEVLQASKRRSVRVDVVTALPASGGLGSSAAIGVAVVRALDPDANEQDILSRAMRWERVFHGNPSGLDALVATRGGGISFERGKGPTVVPLPPQGWLTIGHSGASSSTRDMVDGVAELRARHPEVAESTFAAIDAIARGVASALRCADLREVGRLMTLNHGLLRSLAVSTEAIDRMCAVARENGSLGAKVTGAGGGGCVVSLSDSREAAERVLRAWVDHGHQAFVTSLAPAVSR